MFRPGGCSIESLGIVPIGLIHKACFLGGESAAVRILSLELEERS